MEKNKINLKRGRNPTIREVKKAQKNSVEFDSKRRDLGVKWREPGSWLVERRKEAGHQKWWEKWQLKLLQ